MPTTTKIFLDTNVIIAGSIQVKSEELGQPITHIHFQESIHLLTLLRKNLSKKIGITSQTVENETFNNLIKAVKNEFDKHINHQTTNLQAIFNEFAQISNVCLRKARQLLSSLIIETLNDSEVQANLVKVEDMAQHLQRLSGSYATPLNRKIRAKRQKDASSNASWSAEIHRAVYKAYRDQIERDAVQICEFVANEPNHNSQDKLILAEAITIKNQLDKETIFFIASNDTRFFSPIRIRGGNKSELVTSEIHNRFGITCDIPQEIRKFVSL